MKLLIAKAWLMLLTDRSQPMRTCAVAAPFSARTLGMASGRSRMPCPSSPSLACTVPSWNVEPMGGNATRCDHAVSLPPASSPASRRCAQVVW